MNQNTQDAYWKLWYETYFDAYFQELASEALSNRWQKIDVVTTILVASTASGSAIAGWSLWSEPGWKIAWAIIAGIAAALSIIHSKLGVPANVKTQEELRSLFSGLRVALDTFRQQLIVGNNSSEIKRKYDELRGKFEAYMGRTKHGFTYIESFRNKIQNQLEDILRKKGYI